MKLVATFDRFAALRDQLCPGAAVFVRERRGETQVTCANPQTQTLVHASFAGDVKRCREALKAQGIEAQEGEWEPTEHAEGDLYVGAIAYLSRDATPGLWIDAYREPVSSARVLRRMFEEMVRTGEVGDITFEAFEDAAKPNVIVVSPTELRSFAHESASDASPVKETPIGSPSDATDSVSEDPAGA